ncbi:Nuclear transcription factor Y subunit [Musa troglodytarum]|uniref:Nuclear transcription factor Y subunit n=1 Tax=Musa troglodytarum TaxID=320322 RepID=A0A9E7KB33_9LILI|nr:Nuclear transcription factor Y subunit [Musa troglodytarum]
MMQTAAFSEIHGGVGHFSVSHLPQATLLPWSVGSQPLHGEPFGQLKSPTEGDPRLEASLAIRHKDSKDWGIEQKTQPRRATISLQLSLPEHPASFELGLGQSMVSLIRYCFLDNLIDKVDSEEVHQPEDQSM